MELQEEVSRITEITEILKDNENIKDSKSFVAQIQEEFGVSWSKFIGKVNSSHLI